MLAMLLGRAVVTCGLPQPLFVLGRQLRPIDLQRELVELAGETERHLVIIGHRRAGVGADVEVLVPLQDQRNSALIVWRATSLPSTLSTPVPPRPMPLRLLNASVPVPSPSYLKSNSSVCLPGISASGPSQRTRFRSTRFHRNTGLPLST